MYLRTFFAPHLHLTSYLLQHTMQDYKSLEEGLLSGTQAQLSHPFSSKCYRIQKSINHYFHYNMAILSTIFGLAAPRVASYAMAPVQDITPNITTLPSLNTSTLPSSVETLAASQPTEYRYEIKFGSWGRPRLSAKNLTSVLGFFFLVGMLLTTFVLVVWMVTRKQ